MLTKKEVAPSPNPAAPPVLQEKINQFYYSSGKPIPKEKKQETELEIQKAFEVKQELSLDEFEPILT